jgi:hypothetical protein
MKKILLVVSITGFMFAEGKIGGVTYFDFISTDDSSAFNFQRQYFGYGGDISDKVSYKILFDVGRTELDTRLNVYLKKAQVNYKSSLGKVNFGLIGMNTYAVQESNWGYRFIEKSAIDKNKFSSTADLGVGFSKSIIDNLNLSFQIVNGEGFKKSQGDKYHKIAFNATYGEGNLNKNDGYNTGLVYTTEQTDTDPIRMTSIFGGFAGMGLRLGGEYDMLTKGSVKSNIISVSTNYTVRDNIDVFVRYDIYDGDTSIDNNGKDYLVAGIVLTCDGGISVAPNVRTTTYEDETEALTEYKVNFQFKF